MGCRSGSHHAVQPSEAAPEADPWRAADQPGALQALLKSGRFDTDQLWLATDKCVRDLQNERWSTEDVLYMLVNLINLVAGEDYLTWIVRKEANAHLDETDALGAAGAVKRSRLSLDITAFAKLRSVDPFDRTWEDAADETVVRADAWIESGRDEEGASDGSRLWCRTDVVRAYLEAREADLMWLVRLRRHDGGHGRERSRYWHTTAVIRMSASLEVSYTTGRSNETEESEF